MHYNGYIMQKKGSSLYKGVDGDNWYLNDFNDNLFFREYFDRYIDKAWEDSRYVDCCADDEYIRRYIQESRTQKIDFRILLCSTSKERPSILFKNKRPQIVRLGFDYAYTGGSYYSCILNDVLSKRIPTFASIVLNENGLFQTYEEAQKFETLRAKIKQASSNNTLVDSDYYLESGDYTIYEISEISSDDFI